MSSVERPPCPVCGGRLARPVAPDDDDTEYRCEGCGAPALCPGCSDPWQRSGHEECT